RTLTDDRLIAHSNSLIRISSSVQHRAVGHHHIAAQVNFARMPQRDPVGEQYAASRFGQEPRIEVLAEPDAKSAGQPAQISMNQLIGQQPAETGSADDDSLVA